MNKHHFVCVVLALVFACASISAQPSQEVKPETREITVYAYDAFCGDWGPGPSIVPEFEKKTGIKVNLVSAGDAGQMLTKAESEKAAPIADVVIGISNEMAGKAYESDLFASYASPMLTDIPSFLHFDEQNRLLPFDYGNFAFVYDTEKIKDDMIPHSLADLTLPKYKNKVILIDPRTSSVGLGLLLWTIEVYGEDNYLSWWKSMKDNALTIAEGWSSAYGLFTEGEAPIVLSYTTSPVYHVTYENTTRYQTLLFDEGHDTTVEAVALMKSSKHPELAKQFIDFILSDAQLKIALSNSMYPANSKTELPAAFQYAPKTEKNLTLDAKTIEKNLDRWLTEWEQVMSK